MMNLYRECSHRFHGFRKSDLSIRVFHVIFGFQHILFHNLFVHSYRTAIFCVDVGPKAVCISKHSAIGSVHDEVTASQKSVKFVRPCSCSNLFSKLWIFLHYNLPGRKHPRTMHRFHNFHAIAKIFRLKGTAILKIIHNMIQG